MRLDLYTKTVLTVIAGCLVYLSLASVTQPTHAQTIPRDPDFEIVVTAPTGETHIECVRGCELALQLRRGGVNPNATPTRTFTYGCGATAGCSSGKVNGWIRGVF